MRLLLWSTLALNLWRAFATSAAVLCRRVLDQVVVVANLCRCVAALQSKDTQDSLMSADIERCIEAVFASRVLKGIIMGMRVGSSSASMASQATAVGGWQQRQQGMKDLFSKLDAGDLAGAQKAYASFAANNNIKSDSPMGQLGDALKKGDLASAEKIAQSLQKNRSTSPASAQANANNQQVASTLSMLRGQGGQIDTLV